MLRNRVVIYSSVIFGFIAVYSYYLYATRYPNLLTPYQNRITHVLRDASYCIFLPILGLLTFRCKNEIEKEIIKTGYFYLFISFGWKTLNGMKYFLNWQVEELFIINGVLVAYILVVIWYANKYGLLKED